MLNLSTTQHSTRQRNTTQQIQHNSNTTERNATQQNRHNTMDRNTTQHNTMDYNTMQCNTIGKTTELTSTQQNRKLTTMHIIMLNKSVKVMSSSTKNSTGKNGQKTLQVYMYISSGERSLEAVLQFNKLLCHPNVTY